MPETTATPTAPTSSPASAAPATSTPSTSTPAATSTPASGSTSSSPASTSTPAATPSTPDNRSVEQILADKLAAGPSLTGEPKPEAAAAEVTPPAATETAASDPATDASTDPDPLKEGTAASYDDPNKATTTAADEDDLDLGLDDEGQNLTEDAPLDPKGLAAKLAENPELAALLEQSPELKNEIFTNARLAAQVNEYREVFSSPLEAKTAAAESMTFNGIRGGMMDLKPNDMDGTHGVIKQMLEAAALRDENGEVMRDANGNPVTDGTTGRFLANAFEFRLKILEAEAKASGNDDLLASLDTIMEATKLRAPSSPDEEDLSEREQNLRQENARLQQERQQQQQEREQAHESAVESRTDRMLENGLNQFIAKATGLNEYTRPTVLTNVRAQLVQAIRDNPRYQADLNLVQRQPIGVAREKAEVALNRRWLESKLPSIMRAELSKAGASILKGEQQKQEKREARQVASAGETRAALATPKTGAATSPADVQKEIYAEFRQKYNREPTTQEYISAKLSRSSNAA